MRVISFPSVWTSGRPPSGWRALWRRVGGVCLVLSLLLAEGPGHGAWTVGAAGIQAQFPGEIQGRVVDGPTGTGLGAVRVSVVGTERHELTDGDGRIRVRGLAPGEVQLHLQRFGYEPTTLSVSVRNGEVTRFRAELTPRAFPAAEIQVRAHGDEGVVLDREAVRASGARTVGDLLGGLPGVLVVRRGPGGAQEIRLRGGAPDQVLVLVDGVVLNDPLTGVADLSAVSTEEIERVQVVPGAQAARYGSGALTGVVLVETRGAGEASRLALHGGSLGERGARLAFSHEALRRWITIGGETRSVQGAFTYPAGEALGGGERRRRNVDLAQHGLRLGAGGDLLGGHATVRVRWEDLERGIPGKAFAPSDSARQEQQAFVASSRWSRHSSMGHLDAHLHHRRQWVRFVDPAPPMGVAFDNSTRLHETGARFGVEGEPGDTGRVLVGIEVDGSHRTLEADALDGDEPVRSLTAQLGAHAEVRQVPLPGTPHLRGAFRVHRDGVSREWAPAHGLTLEWTVADVLVHLSHRSSFSPPSAGDLFFREGVGIRPNPHLRGERVPHEVEVGLDGLWELGVVELHLAGELYRGDMQDMIVWAPDFRFVWSPRNVDVKRRGGEVRGEIRHAPLGLRLGGHVSANRTTYREGGGTPGVQVIYRPRLTGGGALSWTGSGWRTSLQARYTGERFPVPAAANALPAFWTFDLTARGEMELAGWDVRPLLRIDRLLGQRAPFIHAFPEPGRTFGLELEVRPGETR